MKSIRVKAVLAVVVAGGLLGPAWAAGQTAKPSAPQYTPPRTPDGQPDFQGQWGGGSLTIEEGYDGNLGTGFYQEFFPTGANIATGDRAGAATPGNRAGASRPPREAAPAREAAAPDTRECYPGCATPSVQIQTPDRRIPYVPAARERKEANYRLIYSPAGATRLEDADPMSRCLPTGPPRASYVGVGGYQFLQVPGYFIFLTEYNHQYRVIPLDGRPHIGSNIRLWMGDARGHWEGDTLVVETTNSNGRGWMDHMGSIYSDQLKVTERYTMTAADRISYELSMDDPKSFTQPWTMTGSFRRNTEPGFEMLEYACNEGNARTLEGLAPKK